MIGQRYQLDLILNSMAILMKKSGYLLAVSYSLVARVVMRTMIIKIYL